jgi:hypothetical protein
MKQLADAQIRAELARLEQTFNATDNRVYVLWAFCFASTHGYQIPEWILAELHRGFVDYLAGQGRSTLGACLKLEGGPGQDPPFKMVVRGQRDNFLATDIYKLTRLGFSITGAAKLVKAKLDASDWNRSDWEVGDVSEVTLADQWKKKWSKGFSPSLWREDQDRAIRADKERFLSTFPKDVLDEVRGMKRGRKKKSVV